jgi:DNA adenine methylase
MDAPFGWPGGKKNLKKVLLGLMPAHKLYVEVFSGSAKLLFAKQPSEWEILNDIHEDVINFFRVAKHRPAELAERLESEIVAAGRFRDLRGAPKVESEVERALRFIYLTWYSFGSKGEHFASVTVNQVGKARSPLRKSLTMVREVLIQVAARLRNVLVEGRDFAQCIRRYDSANTFFYCDPPYSSFGSNGRYQSLGSRQAELFSLLEKIKGRFLLSFDNCEEIRALARKHRFQLKPVTVRYTLAARSQKDAGELLISNYGLPS